MDTNEDLYRDFITDIESFIIETSENGRLSDNSCNKIIAERHYWEDALYREFIESIVEERFNSDQICRIGKLLLQIASAEHPRNY